MDRTRRTWLEAQLPKLFGYAVGLTRDRDRAADLAQQACVKALAARSVPQDAPAFRVWLFRILRNALVDELRRERPTVPIDDPAVARQAMEYGAVDDRLISRLTVRRGLEALSREHREAIALIDLAGLSYAEAAELLDLPRGTVMSRISRARAALLKALQQDNVRVIRPRRGTRQA